MPSKITSAGDSKFRVINKDYNGGDSWINISKDLKSLFPFTKGDSFVIRIHKEDFIKAVNVISLLSFDELWICPAKELKRFYFSDAWFNEALNQISMKFGDDNFALYNAKFGAYSQDRSYIQNNDSVINIRDFLIEKHSKLKFEKLGDIIDLRIETSLHDLSTFYVNNEINNSSYDVNELANILKVQYEEAPDKEKVLSIHMFGIKYGKYIGNDGEASASSIIKLSGLPSSYNVEVSKGVNIYNAIKNNKYGLSFAQTKASSDIEPISKRQVIYFGAPGTGKSFEINRATKDKEVIRTTFHPDSDYSTFVGAYKPTSIEVPVRDVTGKVIIENGKQVTENRIVYEFVEQAFLQAYTKAWIAYADKAGGEKTEEQYLVIEEINRGNCAQIFGDLFQLLDRNAYGFSDYPITADKDMKKQLAKAFDKKTIADAERINSIYGKEIVNQVLSGDILLLPDNLYIWATMNTSDQSLFPIDSAFKRRWDWKFMPICEGKENGVSLGWKIKVKGHLYDWWQFVEKINAEINEQTKSEDKKLGYFFCKAQDGIVTAETFVSKVIFYLWNDIFKDQAFASDIFSDGEDVLTFNKFYDVDNNGKAIIKEDKVELFLQNLGVEFVNDTDEAVIDDEAEELIEGGEGNSKHKSLKSVSFPDGTVFSVNNMTHFEVYLEALKKMGLDLVYPLISNMKYKRKGCPLMSTEEQPGIVNSNYTYQIEGGYYIVKGAMDDTLINVLDELNNQLNLGVQVNYE